MVDIEFTGRIVFNNAFHKFIWEEFVCKEIDNKNGVWSDARKPHRLWKNLRVELDEKLEMGFTELKGWAKKPGYRLHNTDFYAKYKNVLLDIKSAYNILMGEYNGDDIFKYAQFLINSDKHTKLTPLEIAHLHMIFTKRRCKFADLKKDLNEIKKIQQRWNII